MKRMWGLYKKSSLQLHQSHIRLRFVLYTMKKNINIARNQEKIMQKAHRTGFSDT